MSSSYFGTTMVCDYLSKKIIRVVHVTSCIVQLFLNISPLRLLMQYVMYEIRDFFLISHHRKVQKIAHGFRELGDGGICFSTVLGRSFGFQVQQSYVSLQVDPLFSCPWGDGKDKTTPRVFGASYNKVVFVFLKDCKL